RRRRNPGPAAARVGSPLRSEEFFSHALSSKTLTSNIMSDLVTAIPTVRESVTAILRLRVVKAEVVKKGKARPATIGAALAGSAFCVAADRYLVTAFHILNDGKAREARDKFYAFVVPQNGDHAFHFPIVSFPVERPDLDIAILEVGPCGTAGVHMPAIPFSSDVRAD